MAETLLKRSGFVTEHIQITDGYVSVINQVLFSDIAVSISTALLNDRTTVLQSAPRPSGKKIKSISDLAQLWVPMSKSLILVGIKVEGSIIRSESELTTAMGKAWQSTFSPKEFDQREALHLLESIADFGSFADIPAPDQWAMATTLWKLTDSQPGEDGLPYSAWSGTGLVGVRTLISTDRVLRRGVSPPPSFNESVTMFAPNGSQPLDLVEVIRDTLQTRPSRQKHRQ